MIRSTRPKVKNKKTPRWKCARKCLMEVKTNRNKKNVDRKVVKRVASPDGETRRISLRITQQEKKKTTLATGHTKPATAA
ncbi:hypothetical protein DAPPUDRAFT_234042 [Daphnia pulex]|uniref:Uncharacterized protein n=1 Tax=Daphnia pulex TaxID=6669 RepID=E9FUE9_DAPPU|nr:hypothetical protein DAPPUDRAFT_234042 [Daphnia pulex]|eukprot:EFX88716.1 hypothetical protein DAPPUDRAFT_234042 [Daphnia pulex]